MPTEQELADVRLLFLEASNEHTNKTALEIIKNGDVVDGDTHWNTQANLCYDNMIKYIQQKDYKKAGHRANELLYKFGIDVTC